MNIIKVKAKIYWHKPRGRLIMKTMSCKQLGGACDKLFSADSFDEIGMLSQAHGKEMFESGDESHLNAMSEMSELMQDAEVMQKWLDSKRKEFDSLPED